MRASHGQSRASDWGHHAYLCRHKATETLADTPKELSEPILNVRPNY